MSRIKINKSIIRRKYYQFINWWLEQLAEFLPYRLKKLVTDRKTNVIITIDGNEATVSLARGNGNGTKDAVINLDENNPSKQDKVKDIVGSPAKIKDVVIRLDSKHMLHSVLAMPIATEERLRDVLVFEMDKNTPFGSDQVYFAYEILGKDHEREIINVGLYVFLRKNVDRLIEKISLYGFKPNGVEVASNHSSRKNEPERFINVILNPNDRRARVRREKSRVPQLILINCILLAGVAGVFLFQKNAVLEDLAEQANEISKIANQRVADKEEIERYIEQGSFFIKKRQSVPSLTVLLSEITRILPDGTWIKQFEYADKHIKLQGESDNSSALIGLIEASPLFNDTTFISPVTRNARTENDMFLISTAVVSQKASQ